MDWIAKNYQKQQRKEKQFFNQRLQIESWKQQNNKQLANT